MRNRHPPPQPPLPSPPHAYHQAAEERMLSLYLQRAQIPPGAKGLRILDLGCGWGSFTIFAAQQLPHCTFLMISNSAPQKLHIEARAAKQGLRNITVKTRNVATMQLDDEDRGAFDRIVSVEMMEHMKNYEQLLQKVSQFLKPDGLLFVHIFTHARASYHFETKGADDWMGRHFFTGGTMPSHALLKSFQQHLVLEASWIVNGRHYGRTCNAWLKKQDDNMPIVRPIFEKTYAMMRLAQRVSVTFFAQVRRSSGHHVDGKMAWVLLGLCGTV